LALASFLLVLFTAILARVRRPEVGAWSVLGMAYVVLGVVCWVNQTLIAYNLYGTPVQVGPILIMVIGSVFAVMAVFLGSKRGASLNAGEIVAEEVHAAPLWAALFLVPLVAELAPIVVVPNAGLRFGLALLALLMVVVVGGTWSGFHYVFSRSGVEIRTLGFRLRSIPVEKIRTYAVDRWSPT
jgi:hypothetical protein